MLWIKALHIISVICWFAGLFYLPRLFVYHAMTEDQISLDRFKLMERRLYRGIMMPAMIATIVFGIWIISYNPSGYFAGGWLHAKLFLVALLIGYHFWCGQIRQQFAEDKNTRSHVFYRWFNEAPTLLLIAIVLLAVVKPF